MGADPEREHGVDGGFTRRAQRELDVELFPPAVRHPVDLVFKSSDVFSLFSEEVLGD